MKSDLPKVFHALAGEPMLSCVLRTVKKLEPQKTLLVVGYQRALLMDYYRDWPLEFVVQAEQLGTGHAVLQAEPLLAGFQGTIMVLAGDVPRISEKTLRQLIAFHLRSRAAVTDLTAELKEAGNYGRVVRKENGEIIKIVERKDASAEELKINEINTGIFCFEKEALFSALREVKAENAQKEYYLTDTVEILKRRGRPVFAFRAENPSETMGVNTPEELQNIAVALRK